MNHKTKFIIIAVVLLIATLTATAFYLQSGNDSWLNITVPSSPTYDYRQGATVAPGQYFDPVYNNITGDYRPVYKGLEDYKYKWYFGELPPFPKDFFHIAQLVFQGKLTDYDRIPKEYWLQPEFYPGWFKTFANSSYMKPEDWEGYWTPEGYGFYPSIKEISTTVRGKSIVVNTFLKTGYDINAYQGLIVRPVLPDYAIGMLGGILFEQSNQQKKFLSASILNPDDELYMEFKDTLAYDNVRDNDWMVVLEPTHMRITDKYNNVVSETGFSKNWVQVVQLQITIADNAPAGDYVVALNVVEPCHEINQEYYFSQEHEYYGINYNPGGHIFRHKIPQFQCILRLG